MSKYPNDPYPISDDDSFYVKNPHHGITRRLDTHPFQQEASEQTTDRRNSSGSAPRPRPTTHRNEYEQRSSQNKSRPPRAQPRQEPLYEQEQYDTPYEEQYAPQPVPKYARLQQKPQIHSHKKQKRTGCWWITPLMAGMLIVLLVLLGANLMQYQPQQPLPAFTSQPTLPPSDHTVTPQVSLVAPCKNLADGGAPLEPATGSTHLKDEGFATYLVTIRTKSPIHVEQLSLNAEAYPVEPKQLRAEGCTGPIQVTYDLGWPIDIGNKLSGPDIPLHYGAYSTKADIQSQVVYGLTIKASIDELLEDSTLFLTYTLNGGSQPHKLAIKLPKLYVAV